MKLLLDSVDGLTSGLHRRMRNSRAVIGRGSATSDHRRRGTIAVLPESGHCEGPNPVGSRLSRRELGRDYCSSVPVALTGLPTRVGRSDLSD